MKARTFFPLAALLLSPLAALYAADASASIAKDSGPAANLLQNPSFEKKAGDGVEVEMSWEDGRLIKALIHSKSGLPCRVVCGDKSWELNTTAGKSYPLTLAQKVDPRSGR